MTNAAQEAIRYTLQTHIMFSALPLQEKQVLEPLFEVRHYAEGDVIARHGEQADGMYVFYEGRARQKQPAAGRIISVGVIGQDATIGEMSLIEPFEWKHDLIAIDPVVCLVLRCAEVRALLPKHPMIEQHFRSHVGLVEISQRIRGLLGKTRYTQEQFTGILRNLGVKRVKQSQNLFSQGEPDPRLYFIERGAVDLTRKPLSGEEVILERVGPGGLVGETGAMSGQSGLDGSHAHSAVAVADVTVIVIRKEAVAQILEINPGLRQRLVDRIEELEKAEKEELDIRRRAEGVDQRIKLARGITEDEFRALDKKQEITRFPDVRQTTESQNAAACLTAITRHYGKKFTVGNIQEVTNLSAEAVTPDLILRGAEQLGFRAKSYALTLEDMKAARLPGIVGWEGYHYVVVYRITAREVHVADPEGGLKKFSHERFIEHWTHARVAGLEPLANEPDRGVFLALEPTLDFEELNEPKNPYRHFINYLLPYKVNFGEAILAALVINLLGLASPLFIQTIVDSVVVHHDVALLNMMLAGMILVTFFSTLTSAVQAMLLAHTTARIDMRMMSEFYRHILSLPMPFFLSRNKGEILARFGENQKIRAIIAGSTITVLLNTLMITIYFLMMFGYSFTLTIVVLVFLPLYVGIVAYFTPRIKKLAQEIFQTNTVSQSYLIESLNGIESLKATANEYFARARWEDAFAENVNRGFHQQKLALLSSSLFKLATTAMTIVVLWLGANQVMAGTMSIGELMGFNMLMGLVTAPVLAMVNLWNDFQEIRIAVARVADVLNVEPEQPPAAVKAMAPLKNVVGHLEFRNVNFGYSTSEGSKLIMQEFDLEIQPGEKVAFVGPSGCGKSTIAKMILGFNRQQAGEVLIDGKPLSDLDMTSLRRNIGVVLQDSFVFSGTVAENIALGDPEPDMQAVREAARQAGADEFIINYPQGYNTRIGEKGVGISGGQRQRICIARALYHKPRIMIFDEATSALDNESERRITETLKTVMRGRTTITIAHRLSTIMDSDSICFIKDGKVRERGTHHELTDPEYLEAKGYGGLYYELARTQFDLPPLKLRGVPAGEEAAASA